MASPIRALAESSAICMVVLPWTGGDPGGFESYGLMLTPGSMRCNASIGRGIALDDGNRRLSLRKERLRKDRGRLAQWARAPARHAGGHWFKSSSAHS